ncbi:conserved Plasmodium protein, unknown function [Plasmodium gallinaceum]|uniref:Cilia- and flagella-associated protein 91 n=1 Tax=Plasmodium gallinaceum TaxID=5849 RepID=A0A1J1GZ81_PLAGA|nr:conserved Plasmodium protein, unknown function [Plasmodium gallinaceum]CRG97615.1 conserved Plasmodium protein, unknown function [Plasmodium gallinaceum]
MSNCNKSDILKRFVENDENALIDENRKNINNRNISNKFYKNKNFKEKSVKKKILVNENNDKINIYDNKTKLVKNINEPNLNIKEDTGKLSKGGDYIELKENDKEKQKRDEIKEIANICIEKNLAVTSENIQIVRKLKEKRTLEEKINKNENIKNLQEKRRILEEIEFHEWADREKRIKELQEKKMKLLKRVIEQRDTEKANKIFYEVEKIIQRRDENKDKIIENFKKEKARDMRNLFVERKNNLKTIFNQKNDIVDEMNDYTSNHNLQLERNGIIPNKINNKISSKVDNLLNLKNINELDTTFNKSFNYVYGENKYGKFSKYENKKNKDIIDTFHRYLNKEEKKHTTNEYLIGDTFKTHKKTQCMKINFPQIEVKSNEDDNFEKNILYLQNILRGKAIKTLMNDGIKSYSDLIEELKTYEKIDQFSINEKELYEKENFESIKIDSYVENIQGKCVSELLDKLSNELEKHEEERKIAVLVKYAERERRLKECKEKGKRQAEILLREKEDYLFNEIMGLNNQSVDSYLEDILSKAINDASKEEALIRTKKKAEQLNDIYNSLENNYDDKSKLIIKDLVGNFIIPYVDKQRGIEFDQLEEKKNDYVSNFATQHIFANINEAF